MRFQPCDRAGSAAVPIYGTYYISLGLSLAAVLLAWIGILQRKSSQETYKHDVRLYSASTLMKVVDVEESEFESWENQPDGSSRCAAKRYIFRLTNMR
mgnify:CR=1 FL=1